MVFPFQPFGMWSSKTDKWRTWNYIQTNDGLGIVFLIQLSQQHVLILLAPFSGSDWQQYLKLQVMSKKMKFLKKVTIHPSSQFCPFLGPLAPAAAVKIPPGPHPALPGVPCRPLAWSVDPASFVCLKRQLLNLLRVFIWYQFFSPLCSSVQCFHKGFSSCSNLRPSWCSSPREQGFLPV